MIRSHFSVFVVKYIYKIYKMVQEIKNLCSSSYRNLGAYESTLTVILDWTVKFRSSFAWCWGACGPTGGDVAVYLLVLEAAVPAGDLCLRVW